MKSKPRLATSNKNGLSRVHYLNDKEDYNFGIIYTHKFIYGGYQFDNKWGDGVHIIAFGII